MKLLRGVIHQNYKERKHPERYKRGVLMSDEDDAEQSELDLDKMAKDSANKKMPGKQFEVSWLDPNEAGISREEQLRRMNILAAEFNFFAVDRPDQTLLKLITPGKPKPG